MFSMPVCTYTWYSWRMYIDGCPVSLINAHPSKRKTNMCILHSTALRMHIIGPRLQPEPRTPGPQTVHPNAAGVIVARTLPTPAMLCRLHDNHYTVMAGHECTVLPGYPQGCPKLVYGKGWALPFREGGTDTHTGFASADHLD